MKVGVVGVGSLGFHHARLLRTIPEVSEVVIHDSDTARQNEVAAELSLDAVDSLEALIQRVDAAVIAVPTPSHESVACSLLSHGIHTLIEKPIADTLAAADRILDTAESTGALVQTGHVERFNGALRACEPYLENPLFVESHRLAPYQPRGTDVAVVLDLMIHDLDLVLSLMPDGVRSISAVGVPVLTSSPDIANARLEFEAGGVANLTASRVSAERMRKIRFFQRSGYISLDLAAGTGEFLRLKPGQVFEPGSPLIGSRLEDLVERIQLTSDGAEPLRFELTRFVAAVLGREPVAVSGAQGRTALAVALEIISRIEDHVAHTNTA